MDFQLPPNQSSPSRNQRHDGTIIVRCRVCEKAICNVPASGYATVICANCFSLQQQGLTEESIRRRVQQEVEKAQESSPDLYNELGSQGFKATGFGRVISRVVAEIKKRGSKRKRGILDESENVSDS